MNGDQVGAGGRSPVSGVSSTKRFADLILAGGRSGTLARGELMTGISCAKRCVTLLNVFHC